MSLKSILGKILRIGGKVAETTIEVGDVLFQVEQLKDDIVSLKGQVVTPEMVRVIIGRVSRIENGIQLIRR